MKEIDMKTFVKERGAALLSLDKAKILAYMKKYKIKVPENEMIFWAGVHKAILYMNAATEEQKRKSANWLIDHGFKAGISLGGKLCHRN